MTITKVDNGYICMGFDGEDHSQSVYQDREWDGRTETNPWVLQEMVVDIMDFFGEFGSDHDPMRLNIRVIDKAGEEVDE
jgi:hypothetical protein